MRPKFRSHHYAVHNIRKNKLSRNMNFSKKHHLLDDYSNGNIWIYNNDGTYSEPGVDKKAHKFNRIVGHVYKESYKTNDESIF